MSTLFPDEGMPLDAAPGAASVRHALGHEPFVALVERSGADPAVLATDLAAFAAFVRTARDALHDDVLAGSAAVFLGNLLIALHPRADWRCTPDAEVGTRAMSIPVRDLLERLRDDPSSAERWTEHVLDEWTAADARWDAVDAAVAATASAADAATLVEGPEFVAPIVAVGSFMDADGLPIPYGERWQHPAGPPDDAYSRVTHPERFTPLIGATEALIAHLERHYEVETVVASAPERTVTLRPSRGAPIRFRFTDFPAVRLQAGLLLQETQPDCGCDACDEIATTAIELLVRTVLGVVGGGYAERLSSPGGQGATSLRYPDGSGSSSSGGDLPDEPDRLVEPDAVVVLGGAAWPAWPRRA